MSSASPRVTRSRSSAPGRGADGRTPSRPQLSVSSTRRSQAESKGMGDMFAAIRPSRVRLVHFVCALVFLGASLVGSLLLRTQMVEDSFAITDVQQSIGRLTQDVQEDQTKLDGLKASLPEKAQKLGMVPGSDALTVDLKGYKAPADAGAQH